jgi:hypothetical protein
MASAWFLFGGVAGFALAVSWLWVKETRADGLYTAERGPDHFAAAQEEARNLSKDIEIPPGMYLAIFCSTDPVYAGPRQACLLRRLRDAAAALTAHLGDHQVRVLDSNRDLLGDNANGQWFPYEARVRRGWAIRPVHFHEGQIARRAAQTFTL